MIRVNGQHTLKELREQHNISMDEHARNMGVCQSRVSRIESADNLEWNVIERYIRALGLDCYVKTY